MTFKQVQFKANDTESLTGGIAIYEDDKLQGIICGCCGGFIEPEDIEKIEPFKAWMDIEADIRGDD